MSRRGRPPIDQDVVDEVLDLRHAGKSWGQIARILEIPRSTASTLYDRAMTHGKVYDNSRDRRERVPGGP